MEPNWVGLCLCPELKFRIIRHFVKNPELRQNQTQLARSLRSPGISVSRHIRDLVKLRILHEERHGKAAVYSLNKASALVTGFLIPAVALNSNLLPHWVGERIKTVPSNLRSNIHRIVLFGSAARGELKVSSDIDLLAVVSRVSKQLETELRGALVAGGSEAGFSINLHIVPIHEFESPKAAAYLIAARNEGMTVWRK